MPQQEESTEFGFMSNNPLFLRKVDLPQNTTKYQVTAKLESVYGHISEFILIEFDKYFYVEFPTMALFEKAFKDGIDLGAAGGDPTGFYNLINHLTWLESTKFFVILLQCLDLKNTIVN